jgi:hypothetical protein
MPPTRIFITYDPEIHHGITDQFDWASSNAGSDLEVIHLGIYRGSADLTQGEIWSDLVVPVLNSADRLLAYVDRPNVNVGFQIGYALGREKQVALARVRQDLPMWLAHPPFNGIQCSRATSAQELTSLLRGDSWLKPPGRLRRGSDTVVFGPPAAELYLASVREAEPAWRTSPPGSWTLQDLPVMLDNVGTGIWIIAPHIEGDAARDGADNTTASVMAGFLAGCGVPVFPLIHSQARVVLDIVPNAQAFEGISDFRSVVENRYLVHNSRPEVAETGAPRRPRLPRPVHEIEASVVGHVQPYDVFLSYASEDVERARRFVKLFQEQGWSVFWDRESILPGEKFSSFIRRSLDSSRCVVVLWTRASVKSDWVENEATHGYSRKVLVPALLDPLADGELPFGLHHIHAVPIFEWDGKSNSRSIVVLLDSIGTRLKTAGRLAFGESGGREGAQGTPASGRHRVELSSVPLLEKDRAPADGTPGEPSLVAVAASFEPAATHSDSEPLGGLLEARGYSASEIQAPTAERSSSPSPAASVPIGVKGSPPAIGVSVDPPAPVRADIGQPTKVPPTHEPSALGRVPFPAKRRLFLGIVGVLAAVGTAWIVIMRRQHDIVPLAPSLAKPSPVATRQDSLKDVRVQTGDDGYTEIDFAGADGQGGGCWFFDRTFEPAGRALAFDGWSHEGRSVSIKTQLRRPIAFSLDDASESETLILESSDFKGRLKVDLRKRFDTVCVLVPRNASVRFREIRLESRR